MVLIPNWTNENGGSSFYMKGDPLTSRSKCSINDLICHTTSCTGCNYHQSTDDKKGT